MNTCPVCQRRNHHLAVICGSCGSFLQTRVENLDLFAVAWKLVESPSKAFRTIALANHKNYSILLSSIAGFAFTFLVFWIYNLGDHAESLLNILAAGFVIGPLAGNVTVVLFSFLLYLLIRVSGESAFLRNIIATVAYSCIPIAVSFVIIFPIEIMTFGLFLFTRNPSPYFLKPASYILLMILDGAFTVWSVGLLLIGMKTILDTSWSRVIAVVSTSFVVVVGVAGYVLRLLAL